jgi:hypothetical protein
LFTKQEVARIIHVDFEDEHGKLWMFHGFIGSTSVLRADGMRVFVKPQLRRIQHRRWLRQARRVFARSVRNSCLTSDVIQLICLEYVK